MGEIVEPVPIEFFAAQYLEDKACKQITDSWPIKAEIVHQIIVKHFTELGVFTVHPFGHARAIKEEIVFVLRNSPTLLEMIERARKAALLSSQKSRTSLAS